jgi:hypothetical protein
MQLESLYKVKETEPVGGKIGPVSVAVAPRSGMSTPTVPEVWLACTVIVRPAANADGGPTTNKPTAMSPADPTAIARRAHDMRPSRV